jgi:hypothetical protein
MARRLAAVPELFAAAAQQYLPVAGAVDDAAERRSVVGLLRRAADQAALIGDYAQMDALLATALGLISPNETATLLAVHTGRHAALYGLGRLEEADDAYLIQLQRGPLVEHHRGDGGDRLGHRVDAPDRVVGHCCSVGSWTPAASV